MIQIFTRHILQAAGGFSKHLAQLRTGDAFESASGELGQVEVLLQQGAPAGIDANYIRFEEGRIAVVGPGDSQVFDLGSQRE